MQEFISWEIMATFGGSALMVTVLTEIAKHYLTADARWIALFLSAVASFGVQLVHYHEFTVGAFVMSSLNALLLAGTAIGTFEGIVKRFKKRDD